MVFMSSCNAVKFYSDLLNYVDIPVKDKVMKDIKPLMEWAKANSEAKIVDRIFVKLLPLFVKKELILTVAMLETQARLDVPIDVYDQIKMVAEELVGLSYNQ